MDPHITAKASLKQAVRVVATSSFLRSCARSLLHAAQYVVGLHHREVVNYGQPERSAATRGIRKTAVLIGAVAFVLSLGRIIAFDSGKYLWGDGVDYARIGHALASGQGFSHPDPPWPGLPTVKRPPLWQFLLSLLFRLFRHQSPVLTVRLAGVLMNTAAAFGVALLTGILGGTRRRMVLAGLLVALWPEAQPYIGGGACEPCASALLVLGTLLLCLGEPYFFGGVLTLSLLPLVRPNFLTIPVFIAVLCVVPWPRFRDSAKRHWVGVSSKWRLPIAAAVVLFYVPTAAWIMRNYRVTGAFPVIAGVESITLYGSYNAVTASAGPNFGVWIIPDAIPGEEKRSGLSARMSEWEVFQYYEAKGRQFIAHHWRLLPLLMAAHVVRALLPDPHEGSHTYIFWVFRLATYVAAILAIRRKSLRMESWYGYYGLMLTATAFATATTVVAYWGGVRFLYPLTILAIPMVCSAGSAPARHHSSVVAEPILEGLPNVAGLPIEAEGKARAASPPEVPQGKDSPASPPRPSFWPNRDRRDQVTPLRPQARRAHVRRRFLLKTAVLIGAMAFVLSQARVMVFNGDKQLRGDGVEYAQIGEALASGLGFSHPVGLWPGRPTVKRPPFWPVILSLLFRLFRHQNPVFTVRLGEALMNAVTAFGVALLTGILGGTRRRMVLAGLVVALWPEAQRYLSSGECEPCAAALLVLGTLLICLGERYFFGGVLLLSLLPLVRPNFLTIPVWIAILCVVFAKRHFVGLRGKWLSMAAAVVLFYIPLAAWTVRNYQVTGAFPVIAGVEGATLYGSYNAVTTSIGRHLGDWIDPDIIPGGKTRVQLSPRMSEWEVFEYYDAQGKQFIARHWRLLPVLAMVRAIRSMLPDPPHAGPHAYIYWVFRLATYVAAILAIGRKSWRMESWYGFYGLMLAATACATATTVLVYWGASRFLYPLTILAIPLLCSAGSAPARPDRLTQRAVGRVACETPRVPSLFRLSLFCSKRFI